jgi:uncharacterized protein
MARARPASANVPADGDAAVRERYENAVGEFVERIKQDPYILAVILFGSLSYDSVWAKSDIDLMLVGPEPKSGAKRNAAKSFALTEGGLNIHAVLWPRSEFRQLIEGSVQSSFMHSSFAKSKLLFSRDPSIQELYENVHTLGSRDQQVQVLRAATNVLPILYKAEKWLVVKKDPDYSFLWIMHCVETLAYVEVYLDGQLAGREVIQQALAINPKFFKAIYTDLIAGKKTAKEIAAALALIDQYLTKKTRTLFGPVLDYLADAGSPRSATEIDTHFAGQMNISHMHSACEWLADKGVIEQLATPIRLTEKSPIAMNEMAFYFDGERKNA